MDGEVIAAIVIGALCVFALSAPAGSLQSPSLPDTDAVSYDVLVPDVDVDAASEDPESVEGRLGATEGLGAIPLLVVLVLWLVGALYVSSVREFVVASLVLIGVGLAAIELLGDVSTTTVGAVTIPGMGSTQTLLASIGAFVALAAALVVGQPFVRDFLRRDHGPAWFGAGTETDRETAGSRPEPTSEVGRALHTLREQVGLDARTATPREIRRAALETGYDRRVVEAITERFEARKYAGRRLSTQEVEEVTDAHRRLESEEDG